MGLILGGSRSREITGAGGGRAVPCRGMGDLHETTMDGVRCFWIETGRPTLAARLIFRYGMADEHVTESGWGHLLEHLALDSVGEQHGLDRNGQTGLLETSFDAHGEPAAVAAHLRDLTAWLAAPTLDRLSHEQGVLRAEADFRGAGAAGRALGWRYGAAGPGLAAYAEPGLGRATAEALARRAAEVFTCGNAVLVLDGPPPADLTLTLSPGDLIPLPPAVPCETPPAAYEEPGGLILSGSVRRDSAMFLGTVLLERALTERLRQREGGAYAPWVTYEPVDRETAVVVAGSDVRPELRPEVVRIARAILDDLVDEGPQDAWISEAVARQLRVMQDPYALVGFAMNAGMRFLHQQVREDPDEAVARYHAVTRDSLRDAFGELRDSLLVGAPGEALVSTDLRVLAFPGTEPSEAGTAYRHVNWPAVPDRLRVTDVGVELADGTLSRAVSYDDLAAMFTYADGVRHLLRRDGYGITVDPACWMHGAEMVAQLDRGVDEHLHLPHPRISDRQEFIRANVWQRWSPVLLRAAFRPVGLALLVTLLVGTSVAVSFAIGSGLPATTVLVLLGTTYCIYKQEQREARA